MGLVNMKHNMGLAHWAVLFSAAPAGAYMVHRPPFASAPATALKMGADSSFSDALVAQFDLLREVHAEEFSRAEVAELANAQLEGELDAYRESWAEQRARTAAIETRLAASEVALAASRAAHGASLATRTGVVCVCVCVRALHFLLLCVCARAILVWGVAGARNEMERHQVASHERALATKAAFEAELAAKDALLETKELELSAASGALGAKEADMEELAAALTQTIEQTDDIIEAQGDELRVARRKLYAITEALREPTRRT